MTGTGVPILRIGRILIAGLTGELDDKTAVTFGEDLAEQVAQYSATGVLIDVSKLEIIDSFAARVLTELAATAGLLGARVVLAGMHPSVAITLVHLGVDLPGLTTALNAEQGLAILTSGRPARPDRSEAAIQ